MEVEMMRLRKVNQACNVLHEEIQREKEWLYQRLEIDEEKFERVVESKNML